MNALQQKLMHAYRTAVIQAAREHGTEIVDEDFMATVTNLPDDVREAIVESFRRQSEELDRQSGGQ